MAGRVAMSNRYRMYLFWAPRVLGIAFLLFLSLFSFDVLEEGRSVWQITVDLLAHLTPVFVLGAVLALAWRWEWVGALFFTLAGCLYTYWAAQRGHIEWALIIALPVFVVAVLFLANWVKHDELRAPPAH
jgi:uncharacterized membrane protein YhhN